MWMARGNICLLHLPACTCQGPPSKAVLCTGVDATRTHSSSKNSKQTKLFQVDLTTGGTRTSAPAAHSSPSHLQQCPLPAAGSGGGKSSPGGHTACVSFSPSWSPCSTGSAPERRQNERDSCDVAPKHSWRCSILLKCYHMAPVCMRGEHVVGKKQGRDNRWRRARRDRRALMAE